MRNASLRFVLPTLGSLLMAIPAFGQDSHYWTLQYGPRSSLLGGTVIGSVDDISATYYNPGGLALARSLSFAVSTNVFQVSGVRLENGGGEGVDLGRQSSGLQPSMIAGSFADSLFGGKGVLAYSAMNRVNGSQDFQGVIGLEGDRISPEYELRDYLGVARFEGEFTDFWGGLTYAHRLGSHFGIGVTGYVARRSQSRRRETLEQVITTSGEGGAQIQVALGDYTALRVLAKMGTFVRLEKFTAGFTVTTPGAMIKGSGDLGLNYGTFSPDTVALAYTIQTDLPTTYKTPLSIGGGFGWLVGNMRIHASLEWFDKIDEYTVIQGQAIHAKEPETQVLPVEAVQALAEVVDWGLGFEWFASKHFTGYFSYYQDNSALAPDIEKSSLAIMPFDVQALTAGSEFLVGRVLLTLGIGYAWGDDDASGLVNVDPDGSGQSVEARYVYKGMRALFGFEVGV